MFGLDALKLSRLLDTTGCSVVGVGVGVDVNVVPPEITGEGKFWGSVSVGVLRTDCEWNLPVPKN